MTLFSKAEMPKEDYSILPKEWKKAGIDTKVELPDQAGSLPIFSRLYKAFYLCKPKDTRVVMLGTGPYPSIGQPDGLLFSCSRQPFPQEINVLLLCLKQNLKIYKSSGDLSGWARQGILLLNSALTVKIGKSGTHEKLWTPFMENVFNVLSEGRQKIFVLIGKKNHKWESFIDRERHFIIKINGIPNNSYYHVRNSKLFSRINTCLEVMREKPIDWDT